MDEIFMVKWKIDPGQKKLHYAGHTTSAFCKNLHRQHANAKLARQHTVLREESSVS